MLRPLFSIVLIGGFWIQYASGSVEFEVPNRTKPGEHLKALQPQTEAERIWEQAIAAKGGRERLHSVRNLVISSRADYRTSMLKTNQVRQEELYVLPNKVWSWSDLRPDVFGLRVTMYNHDSDMKYIISEGEPRHLPEPITETDKKTKHLLTSLLVELPETAWLKPALVGASVESVGLRTVDIVQTTVKGKRVDFAFDQKTRLPVKISYYDVIKGKTYITAVELSDYVEVSRIKVPQKVKYQDGTEYKQTYQFNVRYNEDIFIHATSIEAGPQAWKPKT